LIEATRLRTSREIAELIAVVAYDLDAEVHLVARGSRVEVRPPGR
jgi:hypothetical protein